MSNPAASRRSVTVLAAAQRAGHSLFGRQRSLEGALLLNQTLGLLSGVLVARAGGAEVRGDVAVLVVWVQLLGWITSLSLDKAIVALASRSSGTRFEPDLLLATARRIVFICSIPLAATAIFIGVHAFTQKILVAMLIAGMLVASQAELIAGWTLATQRYSRFAVMRATQPISYLFGCGLVVIASTRWRQIDMSIGFGLVVVLSLLPLLVFGPRGANRMETGAARPLLRFGVAAQSSAVLQYINSRLDIVVLSLLASSSTVGLYSVGVAVGGAAVFIGPAGAIRRFTGQTKAIDWRGAGFVVVAGVAIALFCPLIIPLIYGSEFENGVRVAQIFAIGSVANYFQQVLSGQLIRIMSPWMLTLAQLTGCTTFAAGLLISREVAFVAATSVMSYAITATVLALMVWRSTQVQRRTASRRTPGQ